MCVRMWVWVLGGGYLMTLAEEYQQQSPTHASESPRHPPHPTLLHSPTHPVQGRFLLAARSGLVQGLSLPDAPLNITTMCLEQVREGPARLRAPYTLLNTPARRHTHHTHAHACTHARARKRLLA